jgi:hypothetical protein
MRIAVVALLACLGSSVPAFAQEPVAPPPPVVETASPDASRYLTRSGTLNARLLDTPLFVIGQPDLRRPKALPALYASFVGLEVMDGLSTSRGLATGAVEGNPIVRLAVEHPSTLWGVKAGAAAASIFAAERMWRHHHRGQAIAVMVASNAVMAVVGARNFSTINKTRPD